MTGGSSGAAPTSTYRLQVQPAFGFGDVARIAGYLERLGVTTPYLSPVLQATPGSTHGYDVVDHGRLSEEAGGSEAFGAMVATLAGHGLRPIADIVPNHMAVPTPIRLNAALWSLLRDGPESEFARWFDVDLTAPGGQFLVPVLGDRIGAVLAAGSLSVDRSGDEPVLRYYEHEFPLRPGTADLPLPELLERQWYRLAWWRVADDELNYRRFFDVDTLAAVRVEDPEVFEATHRLVAGLVRDGSLAGLRIDHPDGLADPRGYLRDLATATGGTWVVVEKILEGDESLPTGWACAGTTGYDALNQVCGLFVDPVGAAPLTAVLNERTGTAPSVHHVVEQAKRLVVDRILATEVRRLVDLLQAICAADLALRDHTRRALRDSLTEILVAMDRYRAYVVPGEPAPEGAREVVEHAVRIARGRLPEHVHDTLDVVRDLVLDGEGAGADPRKAELVVRFQQVCGPVMAKGVEDTTFYRWQRLVSLNEVGADPARFGTSPEEFHAFSARLARDWPATMTALSTHDTKRSEDARARLAPLAELPEAWGDAVGEWHRLATRHQTPGPGLDRDTEYLFWQTLVATWSLPGNKPAETDRITGYLAKATREAKLHTSWTSPDSRYDETVEAFARGVLGDEELLASVGSFCARLTEPFRVAVLGQKLVQLTMPGVADVYQGTEVVDLSLVDPDNRRPVDFARRERLLDLIDGGEGLAAVPVPERLDAEKLLVTSRALRLRREHPEWFVGGTYTPLATSTGNAVAFGRGAGPASSPDSVRVVTAATRLPVTLERLGGWGDHTVTLPPGRWTDVLTGRQLQGGPASLADLFTTLPVALLRAQEE